MMNNLSDFFSSIQHNVLCGDPKDITVTNAYVSDLLSDVMGNAKEGDLWITIMRHLNIVAVASLAGIPAILFPKNIIPDQTVIDKAKQEKITLISTNLTTFDLAGKLYFFINKNALVQS